MAKRIKWLFLILLYLIAFSWDDYDNPPEILTGYRLYIFSVGCVENKLEETIDILDPTARTYTVVGCGIRDGWYDAYLTALGVNGLESEPSNTVNFQFE